MYGIGRLAARAFDFKAARAIGEQFVAADATDFHAVSFIPVKSTALDRAAALGLQDCLRAGVAVFHHCGVAVFNFGCRPRVCLAVFSGTQQPAHRGDRAATLRLAPRTVSLVVAIRRACGHLLACHVIRPPSVRHIFARTKSAIHYICYHLV